MNDYIAEYGDDLEDIESGLRHSLELVIEARKYLGQTSARKAVAELYDDNKVVRQAESNIRGLYQSLEWDIKQ